MEFKVIQINLNNCRSAQDLLMQVFIEKKFNVAVIAEPYRVPEDHPKWCSDTGGKVAFFCDYNFSFLIIEKSRGFVAVDFNEFIIVGCYFPPNIPIRDFELIIWELGACIRKLESSGRDFMVVGDFNARHSAWGDRYSSPRGKMLVEWSGELNLHIINSGRFPTCIRWQGTSIVDLTFANRSIFKRISCWQVLDTESLSDHKYISYNIASLSSMRNRVSRQSTRSFPMWSSASINLDQFQAAVIANTWNFSTAGLSPEDAARKLQDMMSEVCDSSMRRSAGFPARKAAYWWSPEIADLRRLCVAVKRRYYRVRFSTRHIPDFIIQQRYNRYCTVKKCLSSAIRSAKNKAWTELLKTINSDPWGRPYKVILNKLRPATKPMTSLLEQRVVTNIISGLFPSDPRIFDSIDPRSRDPVDWSEEWNVSPAELSLAARRLRRKVAPGIDGIPGRIWSDSLEYISQNIIDLYNSCLREGVFPRQWKKAKLVLLRKPGKTDNSPSSFRPICLLDELSKVFEAIIASRITEAVKTGRGLYGHQYGFQAGKSTVDAISSVLDFVKSHLTKGRTLVAVSLDISNAFNSITWGIIVTELRRYGVPEYLVRVIEDYFNERFILYTTIDGDIASTPVSRGVPQGSVLGPLLWNLGYDQVLRSFNSGFVKTFGYADDTLIVAAGENFVEARNLANRATKAVVEAIESRDLKVSPSKTEAMWFANFKKIPPRDFSVTVSGQPVKIGNSLKYLGIYLDTLRNFRLHLEKKVPSVISTANKLAGLMPNVLGPKNSIRKMYIAVAQSIMLYGAPVWANSICKFKTRSAPLESAFRILAMRLAKSYRTVSVATASVIGKIPPWNIVAISRAELFDKLKRIKKRSYTAADIDNAICRSKISLINKWREWLSSEEYCGKRAVAAILPVFEQWIKNKNVCSYRMSQLLSGHGCFYDYLCKIGREDSSLCKHCEEDLDSAQHTMEHCPAWEVHRFRLTSVIGSDLSMPAVIRSILQDSVKWKAFYEFSEAVMLGKESLERERESEMAPGRLGGRRYRRRT